MHTLGHFPFVHRQAQVIGHMNPPHHQDIIFFLDFTDGLRDEATFARRNFARLQRAAKGAGQSTGCRGHEVVERRGVWVRLGRTDAVVVSDLRMDAKENWRRLCRQVGSAERSFDALDADMGTIDNSVAHGIFSFSAIPFQF
jgi:hypothetical protein